MKAHEIMTRDVISVNENISVKEAVRIMAKHDIEQFTYGCTVFSLIPVTRSP